MSNNERKKTKITIETEGQSPIVLEINGMAAAMLVDGDDEDSYGLKCCICGNMNTEDLVYLEDGINHELREALSQAVLRAMPRRELLKMLLREVN